jgi:protein-L-isoaspartate(D-aspartate) O-methyltransferase
MANFRSSDESSGAADLFSADRRALLEEIAAEAAGTSRMTGLESIDPRVMEAMATVPRHEFVPPEEKPYAWINRPLPIGCRQTISQPFIVALMSSLILPQPGDRVLEVGTGCGYQAAVLSELVSEVYSIELEPILARGAMERLRRLGYDNVHVTSGDGAAGWVEHSPFDGILVTAGADHVPQALIDQLARGGRLVIPVNALIGQELLVLEKDKDGGIETRSVLPVAFVPLREHPLNNRG